jgi:hypothetical protein
VTDKLLELEVRLLILRHGRAKVLVALATAGDQQVADVEKQIAAAEERKTKRKPKSAAATPDLVALTCRDRPENAPLVQTILNRYENRTFLPQLRDVQRLLDRLSADPVKLKSRKAATRPLAEALSRLSAEELRRLTSAPASNADSDYALLAREIMAGGPKRNQARGGTAVD